MPSASVSASAAMSGPSMRRERNSKARLIMLVVVRAVVVRRRGDFRDGQLVQEVIVEHLARDRAGGRCTVLAVLGEDRERDLRVVRRGEGDEERVIPVLALQPLLVVLLVLLHADDLRRAGL